MPGPILASQVMDDVVALMNNSVAGALPSGATASTFTYTAQQQYLNIALSELSEILESNNVPMTNETQSGFIITTSMTDIGGLTGPALPSDLVEIQAVYERTQGTTEDFQIMTRVEFLPPFTELTESLIYFTWQKQIIQFLGATTVREVRLNYIGAVLAAVTSSTTPITLFNSRTFLAFRTAALCAQFVGEDMERAQSLNTDASLALDRLLNISTKGRQAIATRRRPFMAGYKVRSGF